MSNYTFQTIDTALSRTVRDKVDEETTYEEIKWKNGDKYLGEVRYDVLEDFQAIYTFADGSSYVGDFAHGVPTGRGEFWAKKGECVQDLTREQLDLLCKECDIEAKTETDQKNAISRTAYRNESVIRRITGIDDIDNFVDPKPLYSGQVIAGVPFGYGKDRNFEGIFLAGKRVLKCRLEEMSYLEIAQAVEEESQNLRSRIFSIARSGKPEELGALQITPYQRDLLNQVFACIVPDKDLMAEDWESPYSFQWLWTALENADPIGMVRAILKKGIRFHPKDYEIIFSDGLDEETRTRLVELAPVSEPIPLSVVEDMRLGNDNYVFPLTW